MKIKNPKIFLIFYQMIIMNLPCQHKVSQSSPDESLKLNRKDNIKAVNVLKQIVLNSTVNVLLEDLHVMKTVSVYVAEINPIINNKYIWQKEQQIIEILASLRTFQPSYQLGNVLVKSLNVLKNTVNALAQD